MVSLFVYNIVIRLYGFAIFIASPFSPKARLWIEGRKNLYRDIDKIAHLQGRRLWFHCASLGEFEQARPLIEKVKSENPASVIILSFFSPSGYEIRKNYNAADLVLYMPLDTKSNAIEFIDQVKPDMALFVKYEFWFHHLNCLKSRGIPVVLFSSVFRKQQVFFKWYGGFFRKMLGLFDKIFVQNKESQEFLIQISVNSELAFDTRFDRVYQIFNAKKLFPLIEKFKDGYKLFIAGSTWKKDEELIIRLINEKVFDDYKFIIAPHHLDEHGLGKLQGSLQVKTAFFTNLNETNVGETEVLIVNTTGDLSSLYAYGNIAYLGGGFDAGIHNILECAVYDLPVIYGPRYEKSEEAKDLVTLQTAFPVDGYQRFLQVIKKIDNLYTGRKSHCSGIAANYVKEHLGVRNRYIHKYASYIFNKA